MRSFAKKFAVRGLYAAAGGPVILAVVYLCLHAAGHVTALDPKKVGLEILSVTLLAFIAGGITAIYTVDRLPLAAAAMIQLAVLYADYLLIYLCNGWLKHGSTVALFTVIFLLGYALIWCIIFCIERKRIAAMNRHLRRS